jgi:alanine-synthesizing transaminase
MFSRRTDWRLAPNDFTRALERARASGKPIFDLTVSNPTRVGISYDGPAILDALRNDRSLDYDPQPCGLLAAREAVAEYYRDRGEASEANSLVLTTGTSEAYSFVFRLLANPDDEILVPRPSYPLFDFLADLQDVKLIPYPLIYDHGWQIDLHSLENAIRARSRAIVLVNPNNPTGSYVSAEERRRLNEICRDRRIALIADEVFLDYALDDSPRPSFATNVEALTFTFSGLSKIAALPQMKLGWVAVSGPEADVHNAMQRIEVIADTYLSVSAPVQLAARVMLEQRTLIQPQILTRAQQNLAELDRQFARQKSCTLLTVEGGWYAVLRVPATQTDEQLAIDLLREPRVLVHPGHFYDFPQDGFLVLSLIAPHEQFRHGIEQLLSHLTARP